MESSDERIRRALNKPAEYGVNLDLSAFRPAPKDIKAISKFEEISSGERKFMEEVGFTGNFTAGGYLQIDQKAVLKRLGFDGLKVKTVSEMTQDERSEHLWKLIDPATDKYTATVYLMPEEGYFIRSERGAMIDTPFQSCLFLRSHGAIQAPHNVIIAEEGSRLYVVTGCTVMPERIGLHIGITEMYVKKGAFLGYVMIHNWRNAVHVRPRTVVHVEEGATFVSHYIVASPVPSLQTLPKVYLKGKGAKAYLSNVVITSGGKLDFGSVAFLEAENTSAELISKVFATGESKVIARGYMTSKAYDTKGHIECRALLKGDEASVQAVPSLESFGEGSELTHEAALGKIAEDEVNYLISKGLEKEEAMSTLVRGFLRVEAKGIPTILEAMIYNMIDRSARSLL